MYLKLRFFVFSNGKLQADSFPLFWNRAKKKNLFFLVLRRLSLCQNLSQATQWSQKDVFPSKLQYHWDWHCFNCISQNCWWGKWIIVWVLCFALLVYGFVLERSHPYCKSNYQSNREHQIALRDQVWIRFSYNLDIIVQLEHILQGSCLWGLIL